MLVATLGALGSAWAHSPHDVAGFVAVSGRVVATSEVDHLAISADGGVHWDHVAPPVGTLRCAWVLDSGAVLAAGREGVARTEDGGRVWASVVGPANVVACRRGADGPLAATAEGVWSSADGEGWTLAPFPDVLDVVEGPKGALWARQAAGGLYTLGAGGWEPAGPIDVQAIASDGAGLLAADATTLWTSNDGRTFSAVAGAPLDIVVLAVSGDTILAATPTEAVWVSGDAGVTWAVMDDGIESLSSGVGSPADGRHYADLALADGTIWLASWEGLYSLGVGVGNARWKQAELRTIPLAVSVQWLDDGSLLTAVYGGGVYRGLPGEPGWIDVSEGIDWSWPRQILATEAGNGAWFVVGGKNLYRTADFGTTWEVVTTGLETVGDWVAVADGWPADARIVLAGTMEGAGAVAWSDDEGVTWTPVALSEAARQKPNSVVVTEGPLLAACAGVVYDGVSGAALHDFEADVHMLTGDGSSVLAATAEGVFRLDPPYTDPVLVAFGGLDVSDVRRAPDGTLWATTTVGVVHEDAGGTSGVDWPAGDIAGTLSVFTDGRIAVGTYNGSFVTDDGENWRRATDWDRVDDGDQTWWFDGWAQTPDAGAKGGLAHVGVSAQHGEWGVDGEVLALRAWGEGAIEITVDGVVDRQVRLPPMSNSSVWSKRVGPGRHTVGIDVVEGFAVIDGGERWRDPPGEVPLTTVLPECGCGGGGGGAAWLLLPMVAGWRRRGRWPPDAAQAAA